MTTTLPATQTIQTRRGRGAVVHSRNLALLAHCHRALSAYGSERLDAAGWRALGVGSLPAASPGFRRLAREIATGWATYEAAGSWEETIAEIALRQPHWFDESMRQRITALSSSRLDLYTVVDDGKPGTTLRRLRDRRLVAVSAFIHEQCVTPTGSTLAARLVHDGGLAILVHSSVISNAAVRRTLRQERPRDGDEWSRRLLHAVLAQFIEADLSERAEREATLLDYSLPQLARLHRALSALEKVLNQRLAPLVRHRTISGHTLVAERLRLGWHITIDGSTSATVERIPASASHPVDAEIMRQIGLRRCDGVLSVQGGIEQLTRLCAHVAVRRSGRAA